MPSQQPTAFTSSTRRKSASGMSAMLAKVRIAGVVHQHVEPAEGLQRQGDRGGPVVLAGDVVMGVPAGLLAELGRHRRALVVSHVAEHHPGALGDEVPHVGLAHAPGAPGDQRDLAVEPAHGPPRTASPPCQVPYQTLAIPARSLTPSRLPATRTCSCFAPGRGVESEHGRVRRLVRPNKTRPLRGPDGTERGLHRGRRGQRGLRAGQASRPVGRDRHPAGGRRPGPDPAGAQAGDDRHLPQRAGAQEAPGLGVLHRPAGQRARPPDPAAPGPGARRLRLDQRHAVRPREPQELRRLGRGGVRGLELRRRAAQLQAPGGLGRRRQRAARLRRPGQGDQAEGPDAGVGRPSSRPWPRPRA